MGIDRLYKGSVNGLSICNREVFRLAIRRNAPAIIAVHNHPSGNPEPSPEDMAVTRSMHEAGKLLDIDLLDHIVIGGSKCVSLKQRLNF